MDLFKNKYRIGSARLKNWDYSNIGYYFVTICTKDRKYFFGDVKNSEMQLFVIGEMAEKFWMEIPKHFKNVKLDRHIVMPNHIHGIINIFKKCGRNEAMPNRRNEAMPRFYRKISPKPKSLSVIIGSFKSVVTKFVNDEYPSFHFQWQSRFYDHIVRDEESLNRIRNYIDLNPEKWERDRNNLKKLDKNFIFKKNTYENY